MRGDRWLLVDPKAIPQERRVYLHYEFSNLTKVFGIITPIFIVLHIRNWADTVSPKLTALITTSSIFQRHCIGNILTTSVRYRLQHYSAVLLKVAAVRGSGNFCVGEFGGNP